jgi:hypothetical protein
VALFPEDEQHVDPERLVEQDPGGTLVGTHHLALEGVLHPVSEGQATDDVVAGGDRIRVAPQVEAQASLGDVEHAELAVPDPGHRPRQQRVDDPEL